MPLSRRDLLRTIPAAALAASVSARFAPSARAEPLIVRMQEPRNLETPLGDLFTGGTDKFFVRSHFAVPEGVERGYKLTVEGHVENKLELTLADLKKMESVSREIVLECAGNSRVFLTPPVNGLQWGNGAVGQAKWTGVPLGAVLERAKVKAGAGDVVLIGADKGALTNSPGALNFDRGIPLAKCKKDETLLVWNMNDAPLTAAHGAPLTAAHGAPLRALVGGWYGMASVKWLTRIVVLDKPHAGFFQTFDYSIWNRPKGGLPQLAAVTAIQPKAIVTKPEPGAVIALNKPVVFEGYAWAGENSVAKVEYSSNAGKDWIPVDEVSKAEPFKAVRWKLETTPKDTTPLRVVARCTDDKGNTQPDARDPDRRAYMINHLVPIDVTVK